MTLGGRTPTTVSFLQRETPVWAVHEQATSVCGCLQQLSGVLQPKPARQRQASPLGMIRCGVPVGTYLPPLE
jgi:hypothetical protein